MSEAKFLGDLLGSLEVLGGLGEADRPDNEEGGREDR